MNVVLWTVFAAILAQQQVQAPSNFRAFDTPNDAGKSVTLTWDKMPYEAPDIEYVVRGSVNASDAPDKWVQLARFPSNTKFGKDRKSPWWSWDRSETYHFVDVDVAAIIEVHDAELKKIREEEKSLEEKINKAKEAKDQAGAEKLEAELAKVKDRADSRISELASNEYFYVVQAVKGGEVLAQTRPEGARARSNWFNTEKINSFVLALAFTTVIIVATFVARRRKLFIRKIPGLDALDEALGRATEMGRAVFFVPGRQQDPYVIEVGTIASMAVLTQVAKKCAKFGTQLKVPHTLPQVYVVAQEATRQAYIEAGRPDAYRDDINFFVTDDQFAYTAAVDGMMVREKPASIIYMGYFYAESLVLAETGSTTGAIQVAGTDAEHQIPFFVTACDYALIGEELYAAGAYLSQDPGLTATLRGQDIAKAFIMVMIVLATLLSAGFVAFGQKDILYYILDWLRIW